jgi:hypothetical protein
MICCTRNGGKIAIPERVRLYQHRAKEDQGRRFELICQSASQTGALLKNHLPGSPMMFCAARRRSALLTSICLSEQRPLNHFGGQDHHRHERSRSQRQGHESQRRQALHGVSLFAGRSKAGGRSRRGRLVFWRPTRRSRMPTKLPPIVASWIISRRMNIKAQRRVAADLLGK